MALLGKFKVSVMDADGMIYRNDVTSVFVAGDTGEFELLAFHYPVLSILKAGDIVIDWREVISVKQGIVRFFQNECVIIAELPEEVIKKYKA